jgi:hypothetical protein
VAPPVELLEPESASELLEEVAPFDELLDPELELLDADGSSACENVPENVGGVTLGFVVVVDDEVVGGSSFGSGGCVVFGRAFDSDRPATAALVCVVSKMRPIAASASAAARTTWRADAR